MRTHFSIAIASVLIAIAGLGPAACQRSEHSADADKIDALTKALTSGAITQQEFDAKIAQLTADAPGADGEKKAILDKAMKDGVLSKDEYDAKIRALNSQPAQASGNVAAKPVGATVTDPSKVTWTTITVVDPLFKMPAYTVTIPADWTFEGAVLRGTCGGDDPRYVYRVSSPDGLYGLQVLPLVDWFYADDPRAIEAMTYGATGCNLHAPLTATQQMAGIAAKARPNPQLDPVEHLNMPAMDRAVQDFNKRSYDQAASFGRPNDAQRETADVARVRARYNFQGHPEEERFMITTFVFDGVTQVMGTGPGVLQLQRARTLHTQTFGSAYRAPQGRLDSSEAFLLQIRDSMKVLPEYLQAYQAFENQQYAKIAQIIQGIRDQTKEMNDANIDVLRQRYKEYTAWQQQRTAVNRQNFQNDMARKDAQTQNFVDYISDQQYYANPETGETVTVRNVVGFNGVVTPSTVNGNWVQLVPISH